MTVTYIIKLKGSLDCLSLTHDVSDLTIPMQVEIPALYPGIDFCHLKLSLYLFWLSTQWVV